MWGLLGSQFLSGIMNMYGLHKQGKAEAAAYKFQAAQDEENARAQALETSLAEDNLRKQNRKQLGELEARLAENGLSGSTFDRVFTDSANNLEQDALNLRYQGQSQWRNFKNSAAMNRYGATMSGVNARANIWQTGVNTAFTMLGTAAMYNATKTPVNKNGTQSTSTPQAQNIMNYQQQYAPWTR